MTNIDPIRVAIHGAAGRVGREVVRAVSEAPDMELVGAFDQVSIQDAPILPQGVPYYSDIHQGLRNCHADVLVDFSIASASIGAISLAVSNGIRPVIGTTGILEDQLAELDVLCKSHQVGGFYAPNFTIGAVLLTQLAATAARFFDYAEIREEHHEGKIDAPSGTSLAIAKAIAEAKGSPFRRNKPEQEPLSGTGGGEYSGISIHSSRLPGRLAHHEVSFGSPGQTLTLRHDTINRECYMPGVLLGIRKVLLLEGLVIGLDKLLEL